MMAGSRTRGEAAVMSATAVDHYEATEDKTRDDDEAREYLDQQTRRYLGIGLREFLRRAEEGTLPDHPVVGHLVLLTGARPGAC